METEKALALKMDIQGRIFFEIAAEKVIQIALKKIVKNLSDEDNATVSDLINIIILEGTNSNIGEVFNLNDFYRGGKKYVVEFAALHLNHILQKILKRAEDGVAKKCIAEYLDIITNQGMLAFCEYNEFDIDAILDEIFKDIIHANAETIVNCVIEKIIEQMPDVLDKEKFTGILNEIIKMGVSLDVHQCAFDYNAGGEYKDPSIIIAEKYLAASLQSVAVKMDDGVAKKIILNLAEKIISTGVVDVLNGDEVDLLQEELMSVAVDEFRHFFQYESKKFVNVAIDCVVDKAANYKLGQGKVFRSKKINLYSYQLKMNLANSIDENIEAFVQGNCDFSSAIMQTAKVVTKRTVENIAQREINASLRRCGNVLATRMDFQGGSRQKFNKKINKYSASASEYFISNANKHIEAVLNDEEDLSEAAYGVVIDSVTASAKEVVLNEGARIASEAINKLATNVVKDIGTKHMQKATASALAKYANPNAIVGKIDTVIKIGSAIKDYLSGNISAAQLLTQLGKEGSDICLAGAYSFVGGCIGAIGGPLGTAVGAAIGSLAGYIASNLLYASVLQVFQAEEQAKANYERLHEMCKTIIRIRRKQRKAFCLASQKFLKERQANIDHNLSLIHRAFLSHDTADLKKITLACESISAGFGKDLGDFDSRRFREKIFLTNATFEL